MRLETSPKTLLAIKKGVNERLIELKKKKKSVNVTFLPPDRACYHFQYRSKNLLISVYYFPALVLSDQRSAGLPLSSRILKCTLPSAGTGLHFQSPMSGCNDIVMTRRNTVISCLTETI